MIKSAMFICNIKDLPTGDLEPYLPKKKQERSSVITENAKKFKDLYESGTQDIVLVADDKHVYYDLMRKSARKAFARSST
jgi:hypothetical protein